LTELSENVESVTETIDQSARQCDRDPGDIKLVAVTKGFGPDVIESASRHGLRSFGENRAGEALDKKRNIPSDRLDGCEWHFIGHLQSNKVKDVLGQFDLVHCMDRLSLIKEFDKRLSRESIRQDVLIQVNVSGEESKHGATIEEAPEVTEEVLSRETLNLRGLMTIAPWTDDETVLRDTFRRCRKLRDRLENQFDTKLPELSMGMTNDYEVAIEEGATILRIGRALFGERPD